MLFISIAATKRVGLIQALGLMCRILAICLLAVSSAACASRGSPFEQATSIAYEIIGAEYSSPICKPAPISPPLRKALIKALAQVTLAGLSESTGLTPLDYAVLADDVPSIKRLVALGYPLSVRDIHGGTLLHGAAFAGSMRAMTFLLSNGADPNTTSDGGGTPLMVALQVNRPDVARVLLSAGASVTPRAEGGSTALHFALVCRDQSLVNTLLTAGAEPDATAKRLALKFGVSLKADEP